VHRLQQLRRRVERMMLVMQHLDFLPLCSEPAAGSD
jgi:hypothetical protein